MVEIAGELLGEPDLVVDPRDLDAVRSFARRYIDFVIEQVKPAESGDADTISEPDAETLDRVIQELSETSIGSDSGSAPVDDETAVPEWSWKPTEEPDEAAGAATSGAESTSEDASGWDVLEGAMRAAMQRAVDEGTAPPEMEQALAGDVRFVRPGERPPLVELVEGSASLEAVEALLDQEGTEVNTWTAPTGMPRSTTRRGTARPRF